MEPEDMKIHSKKLFECLECDICSDIIKNCSIIECGHSFCEECIQKWLNSHSTCPSCKKETKSELIKKNFIFEKFKEQLILEKEQESETNFRNKFVKLNKEIADKQFSNFYSVFFKGLKTVFNSYENFFDEFNKESNEKIRLLLESNENINSDGSRKYSADNLQDSKYINLTLYYYT
jgi:hypothetical protein